MKFEKYNLDETICQALHTLGYKEALPVQDAVIPHILHNEDVIVKSRTGSGKTASFAIPIIQDLQWDEKACQALVLSPTRELALQIKEEFDNIGAYKRIKTIPVFGKQPFRFQVQDLKQRTHVVVGTPGRVLDHLQQGTFDVHNIRYIVIDEADEMLNMGFIDTIQSIFAYLPKNASVCMFSATLPEEIQSLANMFLKQPVLVEMREHTTINTNITHYAYRLKEHEKLDLLLKILCKECPESCIIFAKTQEHVRQVCNYLYDQGISVDKLHGGMLQEDRFENMKDFRLGKIRILVATDVAARGIDVENVTHIINYDMPNKSEVYIHRIGRSARLDKEGTAITFVSEYDTQRLQELEDYLQTTLPIHELNELDTVNVDSEALDKLGVPEVQKEEKGKEIRKDIMKLYLKGGKSKKIRAGDIVGAICEIDGVTGDDIGVIQVQNHQSYVDILHGKGELVLQELNKKTIKKKKIKVEKAKV